MNAYRGAGCCLLEFQAPVRVPPGLPDVQGGREQQALPGVGAGVVRKHRLVLAPGQPVPASLLLVRPADWQLARPCPTRSRRPPATAPWGRPPYGRGAAAPRSARPARSAGLLEAERGSRPGNESYRSFKSLIAGWPCRAAAIRREASAHSDGVSPRKPRALSQLLFDPQELVVLGDSLAAGRRAGLYLPHPGGDHQIGDERILGLTGPMGDNRAVSRVAGKGDRVERLGERPDLVELDQDRIRDSALDSLSQDRRVGDETSSPTS